MVREVVGFTGDRSKRNTVELTPPCAGLLRSLVVCLDPLCYGPWGESYQNSLREKRVWRKFKKMDLQRYSIGTLMEVIELLEMSVMARCKSRNGEALLGVALGSFDEKWCCAGEDP